MPTQERTVPSTASAAVAAYASAVADLFEALGWDGEPKHFSFPHRVEHENGLALGTLTISAEIHPIAMVTQGRRGSQVVEITLDEFLKALRSVPASEAKAPTPLRRGLKAVEPEDVIEPEAGVGAVTEADCHD